MEKANTALKRIAQNDRLLKSEIRCSRKSTDYDLSKSHRQKLLQDQVFFSLSRYGRCIWYRNGHATAYCKTQRKVRAI